MRPSRLTLVPIAVAIWLLAPAWSASAGVYGRTRREAQEKLRAALIAVDNGVRPVSGRMTVGSGWQSGSRRQSDLTSDRERLTPTTRLCAATSLQQSVESPWPGWSLRTCHGC